MSPLSPQPPRKPASGSTRALLKAEKLTQIAFALPVSVFVGWLIGAGLDKLLHRHWIYIAGLVLGVVAGFVQIFRMIGDASLLAATAPDPSKSDLPGPTGPGFDDSEGRNS